MGAGLGGGELDNAEPKGGALQLAAVMLRSVYNRTDVVLKPHCKEQIPIVSALLIDLIQQFSN